MSTFRERYNEYIRLRLSGEQIIKEEEAREAALAERTPAGWDAVEKTANDAERRWEQTTAVNRGRCLYAVLKAIKSLWPTAPAECEPSELRTKLSAMSTMNYSQWQAAMCEMKLLMGKTMMDDIAAILAAHPPRPDATAEKRDLMEELFDALTHELSAALSPGEELKAGEIIEKVKAMKQRAANAEADVERLNTLADKLMERAEKAGMELTEAKTLLHPEEQTWSSLVDGVRVTMKAYRGCKEHAAQLERDYANAKADLRTLREAVAGQYWAWQDDEYDTPESLTCPIVISASKMRELLAKVAAPSPLAELQERLDTVRFCVQEDGIVVEWWYGQILQWVTWNGPFSIESTIKKIDANQPKPPTLEDDIAEVEKRGWKSDPRWERIKAAVRKGGGHE